LLKDKERQSKTKVTCACSTKGNNGLNNPCDSVSTDTRLPELERNFLAKGVCGCEGLQWVGFHFPPLHPDFGKAIQCVCSSQGTADNRKEILVRASNLNEFEKKQFSDYHLSWNTGCKYGYEQSIAWTQGENEQFLTLYGATGVGKTHLALASAWGVIGRGDPILFYQSSDLIREMQKSIKVGELELIVNQVKSIPNLVIDDLGREYTTDWTTSIFHEIIDHRYRNHQLRTLVTTNHSLEELNDIVGVPVVSRLTDSSRGNLVVMDGTDVRPRITELQKNGTK
tara:strand:+ start:428 stop:1276 length:849 start_codon:yes stop_codon:yes gene_type:complete